MEKVDIQNILQRLSAMEEEIRKMLELICASAPSDPLLVQRSTHILNLFQIF